jgi:hypothetical protein
MNIAGTALDSRLYRVLDSHALNTEKKPFREIREINETLEWRRNLGNNR